MTDLRRRTAAVLGGAVLAGVLASCTGGPFGEPTVAMPSTRAAPVPSSVPRDAGRAEPTNPASEITCDPKTCSLTLRTADPRKVRAFGTSLSLERVQGRIASLTVGDATVQCRAGESVRAGALLLFCDDVTADSVRLTAEVG